MANAINSLSYGDGVYPFTLPYGVCSTDATTAAKTVTVDNFSLETGATVIVRFYDYDGVGSACTLNVNGTGAKTMIRSNLSHAGQYLSYYTGWPEDCVQLFVYDGTYWVAPDQRMYSNATASIAGLVKVSSVNSSAVTVNSESTTSGRYYPVELNSDGKAIVNVPWTNTTYSNASLGQCYATCSTAAATTAKVVTMSTYALVTGGVVSVKFTYAVPESATLNINSKGAKSIYYRGAAITDDIIKAGDIATFIYSGGRYHLLAIDSGAALSSVITVDAQLESVAEGNGTVASGDFSHAEGCDAEASGNASHAEGDGTVASGNASHAEGASAYAQGACSHAEGYDTQAYANYSHAEGYKTYAGGLYSHAGGIGTAAYAYQYAVGKYNKDTTAPTSLSDTTASAGIFIVGIGTSDSNRSNGFRINPAGKPYSLSTLSSSGADYAEYFEWMDGNPANEDRRGRFVTLDGDKIRYATAEDDYILGVVSAEPTVVGDIQSEAWHNMYLKDVYGERIVEVVEVEESVDEHGDTIPAHTERRWVLNPEYNSETKYTSREDRPEWDAIGIVGKLVAVDDGTCQVNGYCYPDTDGTATISESKTAYRVIERLDDTHVRIFIK